MDLRSPQRRFAPFRKQVLSPGKRPGGSGFLPREAYNAPPPNKLTARPEQINRGPRHFLKAGDA